MDLQLNEEQELLEQSLRRYLQRHLPFEARRAQSGGMEFLRFWRDLDAELGIGGAGLPEEAGGFGGGAQAEMIVAAELGRALAVSPYVDALVLSGNLLLELGKTESLPEFAAGERLIVTAVEEPQTRGDISLTETSAHANGSGWSLVGTKLVVDFAAQADAVILPTRLDDGEFALLEAPAIALENRLRPMRLIDDSPSADILLDGLTLPQEALIARGPQAEAALSNAIDRAIAARCSEAAAVAQVMVEDTISYAKERTQFGQKLANFQALQHRMVDMYMQVRGMSAAALLATLRHDNPAAVSAAKVTASEGLRHIAQEAVQLHGAMGLTEELRVGHYFKRASVLESRLGAADYHLERYRRLKFAA